MSDYTYDVSWSYIMGGEKKFNLVDASALCPHPYHFVHEEKFVNDFSPPDISDGRTQYYYMRNIYRRYGTQH